MQLHLGFHDDHPRQDGGEGEERGRHRRCHGIAGDVDVADLPPGEALGPGGEDVVLRPFVLHAHPHHEQDLPEGDDHEARQGQHGRPGADRHPGPVAEEDVCDVPAVARHGHPQPQRGEHDRKGERRQRPLPAAAGVAPHRQPGHHRRHQTHGDVGEGGPLPERGPAPQGGVVEVEPQETEQVVEGIGEGPHQHEDEEGGEQGRRDDPQERDPTRQEAAAAPGPHPPQVVADEIGEHRPDHEDEEGHRQRLAETHAQRAALPVLADGAHLEPAPSQVGEECQVPAPQRRPGLTRRGGGGPTAPRVRHPPVDEEVQEADVDEQRDPGPYRPPSQEAQEPGGIRPRGGGRPRTFPLRGHAQLISSTR